MEEISINDILQLVKKNIIILLVVGLCGGLLGFLWTNIAVDPSYTATAKIYVKSSDSGSKTSSDVVYSKYLVDSYCEIIKNGKSIHAMVADSLKAKYPNLTVKALGGMIKCATASNTEIMNISVTSSDEVLAVDVCNAILTVVPAELIRITKAGSVEIVDYANAEFVVAEHPVMRNAALCAMIAVVLAFVVIFIGKMVDNKIYTREELSSHFKIPVLGVIPDNSIGAKKHEKRDLKVAHAAIEVDRQRLLGENTPFNVAEAYRMARTNISYLALGDGCKKIAVTSAFTGEGKTTACCNLAIALAQNGARVLLIDADMRKPRVAKLLQVKAQYGLSECIAGICREIPVYKSAYQNMFVMTSGKTSENAAELLSSPRLETVIKACEDKFDYIIFDMPPLNLVTDAAIITKLIDGYLLVSFSGYSSVSGLKEALASLERVEAKILGLILAGVDPKSIAYSSGTYRYGRYGKYGKYSNYGSYGESESDADAAPSDRGAASDAHAKKDASSKKDA